MFVFDVAVGSEQTSSTPAEIGRKSQSFDGVGDAGSIVGFDVDQRLTADDKGGLASVGEGVGGPLDTVAVDALLGGSTERERLLERIESQVGGTEELRQMALQIEFEGLALGAAHLLDAALFHVPVADDLLVVE